ncbi:hypothetical protein Q3G72_029547 [Acer saccharum]|nr:hypothetical protein Q3G72_029547 [Acer saccharum]
MNSDELDLLCSALSIKEKGRPVGKRGKIISDDDSHLEAKKAKRGLIASSGDNQLIAENTEDSVTVEEEGVELSHGQGKEGDSQADVQNSVTQLETVTGIKVSSLASDSISADRSLPVRRVQ